MNLFRGGGLKLGDCVTKTVDIPFDDAMKTQEVSTKLIDEKCILNYLSISVFVKNTNGSSCNYPYLRTMFKLIESDGFSITFGPDGGGTIGPNGKSTHNCIIYGTALRQLINSIYSTNPLHSGAITVRIDDTDITYKNSTEIFVDGLRSGGTTFLSKDIFKDLSTLSTTKSIYDENKPYIQIRSNIKVSYYPILN